MEGRDLAPWLSRPGCCGVDGPVPSTTLDKASPGVRGNVQSTYVNEWICVKDPVRRCTGAAGARCGAVHGWRWTELHQPFATLRPCAHLSWH